MTGQTATTPTLLIEVGSPGSELESRTDFVPGLAAVVVACKSKPSSYRSGCNQSLRMLAMLFTVVSKRQGDLHEETKKA